MVLLLFCFSVVGFSHPLLKSPWFFSHQCEVHVHFKKLVHSHKHHRLYTQQSSPFFILHRVLRAQGACVCAGTCVWIFRQLSLQDQSLSMKSCTICKKCWRKKTFKAHRLVYLYFPYICSLLIVFNNLLFLLWPF